MNATIKLYIATLGLAVAGMLGAAQIARGQERMSNAADAEYITSLMIPGTSTPCCGEADAYFADGRAECEPGEMTRWGEPCVFAVIVTDDRPDVIRLPTGGAIARKHIPVGTRVPVSARNLRKPVVPNPLDRTLAFIGTDKDGHWMICLEPVVGM